MRGGVVVERRRLFRFRQYRQHERDACRSFSSAACLAVVVVVVVALATASTKTVGVVGAHAYNARRDGGGGGDVMRCTCGNPVARGNDLVSMAAPDAERTFRHVPLGDRGESVNATVSRLRNPHGIAFDLVTVAEASGAAPIAHRPTSEATWFPGYAWQILTCAKCNAHLGWRFTEEEGAFAVMSRAKYRVVSGGDDVGGGGGGGGGKTMTSDSFVGLALEKLRFTRGDDLTFRWSPNDEAFIAVAAAATARGGVDYYANKNRDEDGEL